MNIALCQFDDPIPQTTWWAPSGPYPVKRWWVIVSGLRLRPATEIEIELWGMIQDSAGRALKAVGRFDEFVYHKRISTDAGTPSEAIKMEFGL